MGSDKTNLGFSYVPQIYIVYKKLDFEVVSVPAQLQRCQGPIFCVITGMILVYTTATVTTLFWLERDSSGNHTAFWIRSGILPSHSVLPHTGSAFSYLHFQICWKTGCMWAWIMIQIGWNHCMLEATAKHTFFLEIRQRLIAVSCTKFFFSNTRIHETVNFNTCAASNFPN